MRTLLLSTAIGATLLMGQVAGAVTGYSQGFEDPGFTPGTPDWTDFGGATITRVTSGTNGIPSSSGVAHAALTSGNGPFTQFGGYSSSFGDGFVASLDIYIDAANFGLDEGFDYSVAVSNQSGSHLRDFIFHVGNVGGDILVNADNNTDPAGVNAFVLQTANGGNNYAITSTGWYTFEHVFRDDAGTLAVDFNLYDSSDSLVYTVTRNSGDDIASTVGGNRYGWITFNDTDNLAIDNSTLDALVVDGAPIPEPATAAMGVMGLAGLLVAGRRRR